MRKPAFCICENKDADQLCSNRKADQLRSNREADQRLCFRYTDSTIPQLPKLRHFKTLAIFCRCTAWFVWDLVETPEDRFSHNEAHLLVTRINLESPFKTQTILFSFPGLALEFGCINTIFH